MMLDLVDDNVIFLTKLILIMNKKHVKPVSKIKILTIHLIILQLTQNNCGSENYKKMCCFDML